MPIALIPRASGTAGPAARPLFGAPHRFFFLVGVVQLAVVSAWWLCVLASRVFPGLPRPAPTLPDTVVHALLMTCGFAPFFMFGFLFTAGPRWLGVDPPAPRAWRPPAMLAALCALALVPLQLSSIPPSRNARSPAD